MMLIIVASATLVACNETSGQGAMKVITFDFNDGTGKTFEKVLNIEESISYTPPAREGYDFKGWTFDKEGNNPFDASKAEEASLTLYAQWKIRTYTVYFFLYEDKEPISAETVNYGESAIAPSDETIAQNLKDGDTFVKWADAFGKIKSDTYVYAELSKINCTVTFKDDETTVKTAEGKYGTKVTLPLSSEIPSRAGYSFAGWFDKDGNQANNETTFKGNATYYAKWTINAPQTPALDGDTEITYGENAVLTALISNKIEGVTYVYEWFENGASIATGDTATIANLGVGTHVIICSAYATADGQKSASLSANITVTVKKATLTAKIETINIKYGDVLPDLAVEYTGFAYGEDKTSVDESGVQFDTQYAQYSPVGKYTIDANGFVSSNYDVVFEQGKIVVSKKDVTAKSNIVFDKQYDGQTLSATVSDNVFDGICQGHVLTLILTTTASSVGEYDFANGTITSNLTIVDKDGVAVTGNYNVTFTATATISLASITAQDYTVPASDANTFTYDTHQHGEGVRSDDFNVTYSLSQDGEYTATQPHFTDAGEYTVYYKVSRDYYQSVSGNYTVTINKAKLDVTVENQNTVYGAEFALDKDLYSVSGNDYNLLSYTLACAYAVGDGVGTYPIDLTVGTKSDTGNSATQNFDITIVGATLTVEKATLSVSLNPVSVVYGNALDLDIAKLATISGLYKSDDIANIVTLSTDYKADNAHSVGGEYYVNCALNDEDGNYALSDDSVVKAQVTVERRAIAVKVNDMSVVYGEALGAYTYTITDGSIVDGDDINDIVVCTSDYVSEHGNHTSVGSDITISATSGNANYIVNAIGAKVTVTRRPVAVNLKLNGELCYGTSFAEINNASFIDPDCTSEIQAAAGEFVDLYSYYSDIRLVRGKYGTDAEEEYAQGMIGSFELCATVANENLLNNYDVTITSDEINVVASSYVLEIEKKFAYKEGEFASFNIADAMQRVLCNGDRIDGTIRLKKNDIGVYEFVKNADENAFNDTFETVGFKVTNSYGDDVTAYYVPSYYHFNIKIEIADISIAHNVSSLTKFTYDGNYHSVKVEGTDSDVTVEYSTDNASWSENAPQFMNVRRGESSLSAPYTVYYKLTKHIDGVDEPVVLQDSYQVQIDPITAYVRAYNQTATYGEEFVLDQTQYEQEGIIANDLQYLKVEIDTNNYTVGNDIGNYNLCISAYVCTPDNTEEASTNYIVHTTNATLKVVAKSLSLAQISDYEVVYGEDAGAFDGYKVVDKDGNEYANVKQYVTLIPQYKAGNGVGKYAIKATCSNENYTLNSDNLELTVTKRDICVKTKDTNVVYGQAIALDYEVVSGTLYDKDALVATFDFAQKNVGEYSVAPSFDSADETNKNYNISTQNGVVTITKATLTVGLGDKQTITYGDDMPSYDVTYTGFAYDETAATLAYSVSYTCDYSGAKRAGTFDVIVSGSTLANYNIVYVKSQLIVKKASLVLTAVAHEAITYGDDIPTDFAYEATGFVNGDDKSLLDGKVTYTTNYTKGADASDTKYTFNVVCDALDNYAVTYGSAQTLVVNKASYTKDQVNEALAQVNLSGTYEYGKTLAAYSLTGTGFEWADANTLVTCDMNDTGYAVRYCKDKTNYNVYDDGATYIKIVLAKADAKFHYDGEFGARWTGSAIDYAGIIAGTASPEGASVASLVRDVQGWDPTFTYTLVAPTDRTQMIDGGIYTVRVSASETVNYNSAYIEIPFNVYAAQLNSEYYTVEGAFAKAVSNQTVYLVGNAFVSKSFTIPSGTTFVLKSGHDSTDANESIGVLKQSNYVSDGAQYYVDTDETKITYKLTIFNGVQMVVNGGILVNGVMGLNSGTSGQPYGGHTAGLHSQIINNGTMVFNNGGQLDAKGYVKGTGLAIFNSGSHVYSPFVVLDYRGGTNTATTFRKGGISPFNQYEMPNIQCNQEYRANSLHSAYVDLYANDAHNVDTITMIGKGGVLVFDDDNAVIKKSYNSQRTTLTLLGNVSLGSLELTVKLGLSITVKMSDVKFPIPWNYDVNIGDGNTQTSVNAPYDYKVLTGAKIVVATNATLTTSKSVIVYSTFTDTHFASAVYPNKPAAQFVVNGTYISNGSFGGLITSTTQNAKVTINTNSVSSTEGNSGKSNSTGAIAGRNSSLLGLKYEFADVFVITEIARFDDVTATISTSSETTTNSYAYTKTSVTFSTSGIAKGAYTYNGTSWA